MQKLVRWFEIPALDFSRAVGFYNGLFDITLSECDCGNEQMAFFPENDVNVGGVISRAKGFVPSTDGVVIYFNAKGNLDGIIDKTKELGGKILMNKTKIEAEGRGSFAWIADTEGNRIGFYED